MKALQFTLFILFINHFQTLYTQTIWDGPKTTFTKNNFSDWTLVDNQDRISDKIWLTRQNLRGIFNFFSESRYIDTSPADTEWAFGTTDDIATLTFDTWFKTHDKNPEGTINKDMVLHLISDDIYIDIKFLSWTSRDNGGGFSYDRSTQAVLSTEEFFSNEGIKLSPNPFQESFSISGIKEPVKYEIIDLKGSVVMNGVLKHNSTIYTHTLSTGLYFLNIKGYKGSFKLIKK